MWQFYSAVSISLISMYQPPLLSIVYQLITYVLTYILSIVVSYCHRYYRSECFS